MILCQVQSLQSLIKYDSKHKYEKEGRKWMEWNYAAYDKLNNIPLLT